jgi:hypothetical protein
MSIPLNREARAAQSAPREPTMSRFGSLVKEAYWFMFVQTW